MFVNCFFINSLVFTRRSHPNRTNGKHCDNVTVEEALRLLENEWNSPLVRNKDFDDNMFDQDNWTLPLAALRSLRAQINHRCRCVYV